MSNLQITCKHLVGSQSREKGLPRPKQQALLECKSTQTSAGEIVFLNCARSGIYIFGCIKKKTSECSLC